MDHHASAERLPLVLVPCFSGAPWETKDFPEWRDRPLVTGQLPDAPSLESYADIVEAWAGGLDEYVLVGDSFGASVALTLAARRPAGLRALVLSGGFAKADVSTLTRARAGAARLLAGPGYPITVFFHVQSLGSRFDPPGTAAALRSIFLHHADAPTFSHRAAIVLGTDLRPLLDRIAVPTLVLTPEDDRLIGPAAARELTAGIPGATELVLPGTGHLFRFTHVHEYAIAVERFLSGRIGESAAA